MRDFARRIFSREICGSVFLTMGMLALFGAVFSPVFAYAVDKKILAPLGLQQLSGETEAPDFTLLNLEGSRVNLKDYRGKVVFLNFWATWCEPCKKEFPAMEKLYSDYQSKGLTILAVSIDIGKEDAVKAFAEKMGATFPILLSTKGEITDSYWTWGTPTSYLIDRKGNIVGRALGPREWDSVASRSAFDALLKE
jgi:peroxiredoxin